jgi:hypothetical protein
MDLWKFILSPQKKAAILKSSLWNSIIEIFLWEKNINVEKFLVSINLKDTTFFVSTKNPLINSEIQILERKILEKFEQKYLKMWFEKQDFIIKCK